MKSKRQSKKQVKAQSTTPALSLQDQLAEKRRIAKERSEFVQYAIVATLVSCLIGAALFLVGGLKAAIGGATTVLCTALAWKYPHKALWAFMIYMPFSGTVTYGIGGGNTLFQLAKDGFYIPALFSLLQQQGKKGRQPFWVPKELQTPIFLLLAVCLLTLVFVNLPQQFNPKPIAQLAQTWLIQQPLAFISQFNLSAVVDRLSFPDSFPSFHWGTVIGQLAQKEEAGKEQPLAMGLLGLKVLMGYIPLISCTYNLLRSKKELLFLTRMQVVLAIVCCALAFVQYLMLETGRCEGTRNFSGADLFKASLQARCFVGGSLLYSPDQGVIRLPGTFVAPWQWGWFLIANAYFTFATAFSDPTLRWRTLGLIGMAIDFVLAVVSGQRIALALVPISFLVLAILTGQIANLKRFIPIGVGLALILGIAAQMYPEVVQSRIDSLIGRWEASPADTFITGQFMTTWQGLKGSMIGLGLGRATNSARTFGETALIETWFPKVMHEIGPIGLLAFISLVTVLTVVTFKAYRSVKDKNLRSYGACYWVFVLFISYNTYYYPLDVDPVAVYYWICAGTLLKLPALDRQERAATDPSTEANPIKKRRFKQQTAPVL
ncbi:hormogonium polysaccharide biosynthesis protein HpsL [Leptolyngbya sp. 'hensonii']|uniref:hormogonium polysaccharide biosynthesis protein HpsL n=1 Tax=Leptolyngbya sp. 'hensonii' TaxID=1922337 RepID=UPI000A7ABAB5|nr:hormogonium polysaccharide biosynthesis protein HpsL [Leptolyngbya sp. 'hensonii']